MKPLYLFDLGGVIVRWTGFSELAKISGLPYEDTVRRFTESEVCKSFEKGLTGSEVFLHHVINLYDLPYSPHQFKRLWNGWVGTVFEGVEDAIKKIGQNHKTACLSNTNALHWDHLNTYLKPAELFNYSLASHQIQAIKPDQIAFEKVFKVTGYSPENIIFFDDTQMNIDAAQDLGMSAYKVDPKLGVLPILRSLKLT